MRQPAALLAALALALTIPHAAAQSPCCDPWTDLGQALAGAAGAPSLEAIGSLADDTQVSLSVHDAAPGGFLPADQAQLRTLLRAYLLEKALYELRYELNNRPDWVKIPLEGILQLVQ